MISWRPMKLIAKKTHIIQCYKFETQTYMEKATTYDLEQATKQGTILEIWVDGQKYGRGGFHPHFEWPDASTILRVVATTVGTIGVLVAITMGWRKYGASAMLGTVLQWVRERFFRQKLPSSFKEHFHIEDATTTHSIDDKDGKNRAHLSYVY